MRRGAPALGVDSARRSGGGGCGARWAAGLGGRGGLLGGGRERAWGARGVGLPQAPARAFPGTTEPARRPGDSRPSCGLPPCARRRCALPAAPGSVAVAVVVACRGERYLRSQVVSAPSPTGPVIFFGGRTRSLTWWTSRVPHLPHLEFWPKPVCLIRGNGSVHL